MKKMTDRRWWQQPCPTETRTLLGLPPQTTRAQAWTHMIQQIAEKPKDPRSIAFDVHFTDDATGFKTDDLAEMANHFEVSTSAQPNPRPASDVTVESQLVPTNNMGKVLN